MSKVILPELGENIETADVTAILVAVGDHIRRDQPVIEVDTEKATIEVPASADGIVTELLVHAGDAIRVGQPILVFEAESASEAAPSRAGQAPSATEPALDPDTLDRDRELAPAEGGPSHLPAEAAPEPLRPLGAPVPAAPAVRALARELGVDVAEVPGSGPGGRITRDDVKAWAKRLIAKSSEPSRPLAPDPSLPDFGRWGEVRREPLSRLRRVAALNLGHAWATVPQVTQFDRADVTELEAARKAWARAYPEQPRLSLTACMLKVIARGLLRFPRFNASLDLAAGEVVYKRYVHLGVAVDTERGLVVPVVRDAAVKTVLELAAEVARLAARARERKLTPDEMAGGTFTVSNLGGLGTTYFSPIVNWPEVAILGVGRAETQAVHRNGAFEARLILPLSISYDHRLIDGADAARFLRWVAETLEHPLLLVLDTAVDIR